jgi:WD40 repeat protein
LIGRLEATIETLYGYDQPIADLFAISLLGYDAGGGFFAGKVGVPVCKVAMQSNVLAPGASATCSADFQLQGELPILVEAHRGSLLLAVKWSGRTEEGRWQLQRFQNPVVSVAMDVGSGDRWGSIAFSPDGTTIAIAPCGPVQLRRVSDGSLVRILNAPNTMWGLGSEASVAFSRDGALLASGACLENTDYLWSVSSGTLLQTFGEGERSTVSAERRWVAFNPDGKSYLSVSYEGMVRTRQVSDGTLLNEWPMRDPYSYPYEVAFSNDGMMLASWGWRTRYNGETKPLVLWKASEGTVLRVLGGHGNEWVGNAAFSPDGKMLASVGGDDTLKFWQISDGTLLRAIGLPNGGQSAVAFSPHGEIVVTASGGGTSGSSISLWRVSDGTLLRTLKSRSKWIFDLEFSPDGSVLAFAASDEARLWWLPELDPK